MRKNLRLVAGLIIFFVSFVSIAAAHSATATLSGTITDERGAVVPDASVKLTDAAKSFGS